MSAVCTYIRELANVANHVLPAMFYGGIMEQCEPCAAEGVERVAVMAYPITGDEPTWVCGEHLKQLKEWDAGASDQ